jgi:hypothetical protein
MKRIIASLVLCAACASTFDVDLDEFSRIPDVPDLDYSKVVPAGQHDYWELRFAFDDQTPTILGSGGRLTREQLGVAVRTALDTTRSRTGFAISCLPGYCFKYVAAANGSVQLYTTAPALAGFLGTIDSMEEAALLAHARGLYWDDADHSTGFRQVPEGWEILGLQLMRACAPIITDRVLLLVARNGTIRELDRGVYRRDENACI